MRAHHCEEKFLLGESRCRVRTHEHTQPASLPHPLRPRLRQANPPAAAAPRACLARAALLPLWPQRARPTACERTNFSSAFAPQPPVFPPDLLAMASRDLTTFFIRSRSLFHRPKAAGPSGGNDSGDLLGASGDASVDMSSLALSGASPVYVETVNELQSDLGSIATRRAWHLSPRAPLPPPPWSAAGRARPGPRPVGSLTHKRARPHLPHSFTLSPPPTPHHCTRSGEHDAPVRPARAHQL
jgi:hypothetical protein